MSVISSSFNSCSSFTKNDLPHPTNGPYFLAQTQYEAADVVKQMSDIVNSLVQGRSRAEDYERVSQEITRSFRVGEDRQTQKDKNLYNIAFQALSDIRDQGSLNQRDVADRLLYRLTH